MNSPESSSPVASGGRWKFFKESGWMLIATVAGGAFMFVVHKVAKQMPKSEYGVFTTLLQIVNLMGIPAIGLQTTFAQQAATVVTDEQRRQLVAAVRGVLRGTFYLWLLMALGVAVWHQAILEQLGIFNPAALWVTVAIGLASLWLPVMQGLLQGRQNFLWLGLVSICSGLGRFVAIAVIVLALGGHAAGAMGGVMVGLASAAVVGGFQSRTLWLGPGAPFAAREWLGRVVPLTLGLGAALLMLSADMIFVQSHFDKEQTGLYAAAGMIGRALVFFTVPLTSVMFPKLVRSAARAEKSNVLAQALAATGLLGACAAVTCSLVPWLPLRLVYDASFLKIAYLVPWFAWCMLPLTLANVLVNSLLARQRFDAVPWLVGVALAYGAALFVFGSSFLRVVQTLGGFSLLLLAVAAWFTWGKRPTRPVGAAGG